MPSCPARFDQHTQRLSLANIVIQSCVFEYKLFSFDHSSKNVVVMLSCRLVAAIALACCALVHTRASTGVNSELFRRIGFFSGETSSLLNLTTRSLVECAATCLKKQPRCHGMLVEFNPGRRVRCYLATPWVWQRVLADVRSEGASAKSVYVLQDAHDVSN